jgi:hypothetical protein
MVSHCMPYSYRIGIETQSRITMVNWMGVESHIILVMRPVYCSIVFLLLVKARRLAC